MKQNDTGDFCVLYVEPTDDSSTVFNTIIGQKKPVVILLADSARALQRPEDFMTLKHVKRQIDLPILLIIAHSERLTHLALRNGLPVYISMDALSNALAQGQLLRTRVKTTTSADLSAYASSPKKTVRLAPAMQDVAKRDVATRDVATQNTAPLPPVAQHGASRKTTPLSPIAQDMLASSKQQILTEPLSPNAPIKQQKPQQQHFPTILIVLTLLALLAAGLGSFLLLSHKMPTDVPAAPQMVGHLYFLSSEQLSENSNQGINDEVQLDLSNIAPPAQQKSYYAWLLSDRSQADMKPILLGKLQVNRGRIQFFYPGDAHHTNLLAITSRLLITEEDAAVMPIAPSPDDSTWRYYGEIAQTPIASIGDASGAATQEHFSYLDHLRHLLASDPLLDQMELPGGLNNWLYRNTGKILEWTSGTREHWEETPDVTFIRRQTIRTLAYLDGLSYIQQDVPPTIPLGVNDRLARIGLLPVNGAYQDPPSYLEHIVFHLNGLMQADASNSGLRQQIAAIITALNDIRYWLMQVRQDGQKLMQMTDDQMHQPTTLSLLNDMIANANNAYVGQEDTTTGEMHQGVTWVHSQIQSLATLEIVTFSPTASSIQMIRDARHTWG